MRNSFRTMSWMRYILLAAVAFSITGCNEITVGGTISGLTANGLVLANGYETVSPAAGSSSFTFPTPKKAGDTYNVFVKTQPDGLFCSVSKGSGTIAKTAVSDVAVACVAAPANEVSVTVTSPADGAAVSGNTLTVAGTFMGPINTGITVNGIVAVQDSNRFYAQVPLAAGANALTVTATTPAGNKATQTLNITSSGTAPIQVIADMTSGMAPLTVNFKVQNSTANAIAKIEADFNGDAVIDLTTADPAAPLQFIYAAPGAYPAHFKMTDARGGVVETVVTIGVQDKAQIDQMVKAHWSGMNSALVQGSKAQAKTYLTAQAQEKYGPVFDALSTKMPVIVASYSQFQMVSISPSVGEYAVNRTINGVNRIFFVYFMQGDDGVWRLESM